MPFEVSHISYANVINLVPYLFIHIILLVFMRKEEEKEEKIKEGKKREWEKRKEKR